MTTTRTPERGGYKGIELLEIESLAPTTKQIERNEGRRIPDKWNADDVIPCVVCGRPLNPKVQATWWIEAVEGSPLILFPRDAGIDAGSLDDGSYMGCHPIGSTCAKKIPMRYRWKTKGEA